MNRKQRRHLSPDKGKQEILKAMSESYSKGYEKGLQDGYKSIIDTATLDIMSSVLLYFRDKEGWGRKRCLRLLEYINNQAKCQIGGYVTLEDKLKTIEKELNIKMK